MYRACFKEISSLHIFSKKLWTTFFFLGFYDKNSYESLQISDDLFF